ncbi:hypothetical protein ALO_02876 [Acetonema longum DSM 6540]|uniref:Uncharacterized protein n=1 Tax=Acetonema longum DSM 6540 TaxID=1009370 RepID=F7NEV8_9FIRM|nr:hypothetical protein ALO_02876 [Acetonema longum DSM 6540]
MDGENLRNALCVGFVRDTGEILEEMLQDKLGLK